MVARAFAEFTDVKVDFLHGHSARVADLAATAAEGLGCSRSDVAGVRAAGLLHDVGRVAVPNGISDKPGASTQASASRSGCTRIATRRARSAHGPHNSFW